MDPQARIKSLSEQGSSVEIDVNIPLKRYFRSGVEMSKIAAIYEEEGNLESAFILYVRYITLFVEKLRNHPDFQNSTSIDKSNCHKKLKVILPKAENLKARLQKKYQKEHNELVAEQKILEEKLRLEKEEKLRKEKENEENSEARNAILDPRNERWNNLHIAPYDGVLTEDTSIGKLSYPTDYIAGDESGQRRTEEFGEVVVPSRVSEVSAPLPSRDLKPEAIYSVPAVNRGTKPLSLLCANHDQKGGRLRTILIPHQLMDKFLKLAFPNTSKNIETCGILAGKMAMNKFVITHLLIPQQVGTADSCTTQHEEELFDQQDKYDLITLGWIHTHPSQTAFLSSVDLHTHCSYQLMMPEALAIVCAPKFNETGFFTLTQSHGLQYIANCRENGFHPHPSEPPLFHNADHTQIDSSLDIQVVDLRR